MHYLRARYLNPNIGRFWTMDRFEGDEEEPMSLHKYLYCRGNPIDNVDPEGQDTESVINTMFNFFTAMGAPVYPESKAMQKALINGGSPSNLAKRKRIVDVANKYNGSHLWDYAVKRDNFPPNSNKCNKFVFDVTKEAGAEATVTIGGSRRPPLAAEYADKNTTIPNWRPLAAGENPQPGDIAAFKISGGGAAFSGHSRLIVVGGNLSAHDDGVYGKLGQFENNPATRYRRYTGN